MKEKESESKTETGTETSTQTQRGQQRQHKQELVRDSSWSLWGDTPKSLHPIPTAPRAGDVHALATAHHCG